MKPHVRRKDALAYHAGKRPGKIEVVPTKPVTTQRDLALAYSPGVAEPCRAIAADPSKVWEYTTRGNLVAVVTNGTAVLGLGNIGPLAAKPVMEGKGVLFKKFADIDVFDIELDAADVDRFVEVVCALAPTFGGINLEDVKSPECFEIEARLRERLDIPVFHDDQHGTAIISGAALLNAAELQGKALEDLRVVVSGAGASAIACARFYCALGVRQENVVMCDSHGVIYRGRTEGMNPLKEAFAVDTDARTLADALVGADVFLGLSVGGLVTREMVEKMAPKPIVFALANPDPEIMPDEVLAVRPDAIVATGRSDFDNQVNNVLGFPFIFRGALDVRATQITEGMKVAAARALAALARKDVPTSVRQAYGEDFSFGPRYIIPKPFDPRVLTTVAPAVAEAAMVDGVAQVFVDLDEYRERLRTRMGGVSALMRKHVRRASRDPHRIVFPEGEDLRILQACAIILDEHVARPVLLGRRSVIEAKVREVDLELDLDRVEIVDPVEDPAYEDYVERFYEKRQRKGVDREGARKLMREPNHFGMMMVAAGRADGVVTGISYHYPETIRPALQIIGLAPGVRRTAGMYMLLHKRGTLFFGDTTVNLEVDADVLADVAEMLADAARTFDVEPRIAMLSFSNFGSVRHVRSGLVAAAADKLRKRRPDLEVDGEMQANVAVDYALQKRNFPFTRLSGPANVFVFPNLEAGNIAYKMMRELGDVPTIGPMLLGMDAPVNVLERDCSVDNIVHMTALTVLQAQQREQRSRRAL
ncbi:MAG: NADP-dependent malic enzyme [Deltaproteobacteria bacterium]|nr:MAG: NADP-dependent malic enzyme [Deltaproteobacteria bacterium]